MVDMNPGPPDKIATELDLTFFLMGDPLFDESPASYASGLLETDLLETDLSDDPQDSDILAKTLAGNTYLRAPEPPAGVIAMAGLVFLWVFKILRRMRGRLRRMLRQKTQGRRRRVRIDVRMMS